MDNKPIVQSNDKLTSQYEDLHSVARSRLTLSTSFSDQYRKKVKKWLADYNVESFDQLDKADDLQNKLQIPYIFSTVEANLPSMFERVPQLIMKQRGKKDEEFTEFSNQVWDHVADITDLEEKVEEGGFAFLIAGMMSAKYGWKMETETVEIERAVPIVDVKGNQVSANTVKEEVEIPVENKPFVKFYPFNRIYFSPESKFVMEDKDNEIPYIICEELMSPDEIEDKYGIKADDIQEDTYINVEEWDLDLNRNFKGVGKKDLKRFHVYHYYGVLPKKESKDKNWRSRFNYHFAFTKSRMLEKPERVDIKPIVMAGNYGDNIEFYRFGEPKVLRELEQDVSLGRSSIADYRDKIATKIALPQETNVDEFNLKSPKKFTIVRFAGGKFPAYINPPSIPEPVVTAIQMSREDIQIAAAQLDLSRGGTSSVVETATGQKIFEQAQERRINRKRKKIARFIRYIAKNLLKLCAKNWDLREFAKITDMDEKEIEAKGLVEKLSQIGRGYDVEIDIEDVTNNQAARAAEAIALYRETRGDEMVNREEVLKLAIRVGFNQKDPDRFLSQNMSPDQLIKAIMNLQEMQLISPPIAEQMVMFIQSQQAEGGQEGRPASQNPVDIVKKGMLGSDQTQMTAQRNAAYKQTNVPKGPQNV